MNSQYFMVIGFTILSIAIGYNAGQSYGWICFGTCLLTYGLGLGFFKYIEYPK